MEPKLIKKYLLAMTVFVIVCMLCKWQIPQPLDMSTGGSWHSIIPPLLAICLAIASGRAVLSLFAAVILGGLMSGAIERLGAPTSTLIGNGFLHGLTAIYSNLLDSWCLQVLGFVVLVVAMIYVLLVSGGFKGMVMRLSWLARGPRSTQIVTVLMGFAVFIDDYANTLIIGSSMRPLTDRYKISREKLAFLVDATAAPVAGLAFISTWIGTEVGLFSDIIKNRGGEIQTLANTDGYSMFFDALPFRFYCIMMIFFVMINAISGRDYSNMLKAEQLARNADPHDNKTASNPTTTGEDSSVVIRAKTAIIPIVSLVGFILLGFAYYIMSAANEKNIDLAGSGWFTNIRKLLGDVDTIRVLFVASIASMVVAIICATAIAKLPLPKLGKAIFTGVKQSILPVSVLLLAWSLGGICKELHTGNFIGEASKIYLTPITYPLIVFIVAAATAFATGTSWGTMAILIPIVGDVALSMNGNEYGLLVMISLAAVLDGAIFGDHCSPISDTTILSSTASECDHIKHVKTQIPYGLTVAALAIVCGYLPAAYGIPYGYGLILSVAIIIGLFYCFGKTATTDTHVENID